MNDKERFAEMIRQSQRIVAFTGAGISTESGIPDFRSAGGMFDRLSGRHLTGEETLSIGFLETYPALFFRNYAAHFDFSQALPNAAHRFFVALEQTGKEVTVVTQNIDNLHQSAGSSAIIELHGNGTRWRTFDTAEPADASVISMDAEGIQRDQPRQDGAPRYRPLRRNARRGGDGARGRGNRRGRHAGRHRHLVGRLPGRELRPLFQRPLRRPAEPDARAAVADLPIGRPDRCGRLFGGRLGRIF